MKPSSLFFVTDSKWKSFPSCLHASSTCHMIHIFLMLSTQLLVNSNQRFGTAVVLPGQLFYIVKLKLFIVFNVLLTPDSSLLSPLPSLLTLTPHFSCTPHSSQLTPYTSLLPPLPSLLTITPHFSCTPHPLLPYSRYSS